MLNFNILVWTSLVSFSQESSFVAPFLSLVITLVDFKLFICIYFHFSKPFLNLWLQPSCFLPHVATVQNFAIFSLASIAIMLHVFHLWLKCACLCFATCGSVLYSILKFWSNYFDKRPLPSINNFRIALHTYH